MKFNLLSHSKLKTILLQTFGPMWNKSIVGTDQSDTKVASINASTKQAKYIKGLQRPPANNNHKWVQAIKRVLPAINLLHGYEPTKNMNSFCNLVAHLLTYHGEVETIKRLKLYRLSIQRYILKQPEDKLPFHKYSGPLPKRVRWLRPQVKSTKQCRYALSVMRVIELFRLKPSRDVSTITDTSTACPDTLHKITRFIKKCKWLKKVKCVERGYLPMTNRAGPNGPAAISAIADLTSLRKPENDNLLRSIANQLRLTIPWLDMDVHDDVEGDWKHSILVFLSDRAGKTRTIGIADWWSNAALSNIHITFMKALRGLKTDLTFHQDSLNDYIKELGSDLFSSDMSAFTDRFPIELEAEVVKAVHGERQAQNWRTIISERLFDTGTSQVKYQVGNPMGILSSWPVSTATHHVIKLYCTWKLAKADYKYGILGDDSIDTCQEVYTMYQDIIQKLGVNISQSKCTTSNDGSCEFAKRLFRRNGVEVTGVPVYLLQNLEKFPEQTLELIKMCRNRGYSDKNLGPAFENILKTLSKEKRTFLTDILSLPEPILRFAPLLEVKPDTFADKLHRLKEDDQKAYLERARDLVFWEEVRRMEEPSRSFRNSVRDFQVKPNHPLIHALMERADAYIGLEPDPEWNETDFSQLEGFSIYKAWMRGDYRYLAKAPSLDTYKYYSKGHKATKCNYLVLKKMLKLVDSDNTHLFVHNLHMISDLDLYDLHLDRLQQATFGTYETDLDGNTIEGDALEDSQHDSIMRMLLLKPRGG